MAKRDVMFGLVEKLSWESDKRQESLDKLFDYAGASATSSITWYLGRKASKRSWAMTLRVGSILLAAAAGILPITSQIWTRADGRPWLAPAWASVALAVAALMVALDRFFGHSSGWMRYILTQLRLQQALLDFQFGWQAERAVLKGAPLTDEQLQRMLQRIRAFLELCQTIMLEETRGWVDEFRSALTQVDELVKAKAATNEVGGLTVQVTNGHLSEDGWELELDGAQGVRKLGTTAAYTGLTPAIHHVRVRGRIGGRDVQAEGQARVPAGGLEILQLTLS